MNRPVRRLFPGRARALVALALTLSAARLPAQDAPAPEALRPGDLVRITVFRKPELSGEMEVGADGTLLHPLYRSISVAGTAPATVEQRVGEFLRRYEAEPSFVVEPLYRVTVGGEVRTPAVHTVRPGTTVFQALSQSGGASERGRADRVRLFRGAEVQLLDLSPQGGGGAVPLRSGDVLMVERRQNIFRDYVQPSATLVAAAAALVNLFRN